MKKKIWYKVFLAVMLIIAVLLCTACSNANTGFLNTLREAASVTKAVEEGTIIFEFDAAKEFWDEAVGGDEYADMLKNITFSYKAEADAEKLQAKINGELTIAGAKLPLNIYLDKFDFYIKAADVVQIYQFFDKDNATGLAQLKALIGDAEWISLKLLDEKDIKAFEEMYSDADVAADAQRVIKELNNFWDKLQIAYKGYDPKLLTQRGNTYTISLSKQNIVDIVADFMKYSLENIDQISNAIIDWVNDSELFEAAEKPEVIDSIKQFAAECKDITVGDLTETKQELAQALKEVPLDFKAEYSLTRNSATSFGREITYKIDFNDPDDPAGKFTVKLTAKDTTNAVNTVNIDIPAEKVTCCNDWSANGLSPDSITATIYLDEDYMYYHKYYALPGLDDSGTVTPGVKIINNTTYLALRPVAEACGEEVSWDSARKCPIVVRGDKTIPVTGYVDTANGHSYLKIRDFEKLGYTVDYQKTEITGNKVTLSK